MYAGLFRAGVVWSLRAMRWDRQRVGALMHGRVVLIESQPRISSFSPLSLLAQSAVDVDVRVFSVTFSC